MCIRDSYRAGSQLLSVCTDNLIIITDHNTSIHLKSNEDGISELYSISGLGTRTTENIRKGYLLGKYGATPDIEIEEVE